MADKAPEDMTIEEIKEFLLMSPTEILEYAQKRAGMRTKTIPGKYPVEYDPIRRYCHMIDDLNPLYLDKEYAIKAGFKDVVCPPLLVGYFAGQGVWPPGQEFGPRLMAVPRLPVAHFAEGARSDINMATEWEFYKPVTVGDHLSSYARIGEPYMKAIKRDPEALWFVTENVILNQNEEEVAVSKTIQVGWRREIK